MKPKEFVVPGAAMTERGERGVRREKGGRSSTGEIVHFVVQDYTIGSHEPRTPKQVNSCM